MITNRPFFLKYIAQTSDSPLMLEIEKADGIWLISRDDKRYVDLVSGISVNNLGHNQPEIIKAAKEQLDKYMHLMVYGEYIQEPQVELAKLLAENLPPSLNSVYFVNSGSEAVEGAVKLAKRHTGRPGIISFKNAYHGSTSGALSLMGNEEFRNSFRPLLPGIISLRFNELDDLARITDKCACVIIEPVQAEAGVYPPKPGYLKALRDRCTETGALLIFDEIQTGFGRTGELFAFEKYDVVPDILLLAKSLGGGMPLGAFISSGDVMADLKTDPVLGHITTFGGHPVSCAAGLAALNILISEKQIIQQVVNKEKLFRDNLKHPSIKEIRGDGLLLAIEMDNVEKVKKVIQKSLERGIVLDIFLFCETAFRIAPPLIISEEEIIEVCEVLTKVLDEI